MSRETQALLEAFEQLRPEERRTFAEEIRRRSTPSDSEPMKRNEALWGIREQEWLRDHWREHIGQWIALDGNLLVGEGRSAREAHSKAREAGHPSPVLVHVTEPSELPFGGW